MIPFAGGTLEARRWRTFENLTWLEETRSSQDLARELIDVYFGEDQRFPASVIVADSQPGARGRRGTWSAPAGRGLYFTFIREAQPGEPVSLIPIAVARWVREVLREKTGVNAELKWPNDLYVGRRKLAGVLAESTTQGNQTYVTVGVGINVLGPAATLGISSATTLEEETGGPFALAPLLQALLDRIDKELAEPRWEAEVREWEKASAHRHGDRLTVRREGKDVSGAYLGLTPEGFLRLETPSGEVVLAAGEVAQW